ncbi:MAG: riboflavin biosynthesis protein RibF [Clostridia bacterium]
MKILYKLDDLKKIAGNVVLGNFDGVHIGHQKLIKLAVADAKQQGIASLVITFTPHPRTFFEADSFKLIMNETTKEQTLATMGIDYLAKLPFSAVLANMDAEDFIRQYLLANINISKIFVGVDYHFGKAAKGDIMLFKRFSEFTTVAIEPLIYEGEKISSSRIKYLIGVGDMEKAFILLGKYFMQQGKVDANRNSGRKFGFSTAIILVAENYVQPAVGVYACKVKIDQQIFAGMVNVTYGNTIQVKNKLIIEVHIFDFLEEISGKKIDLYYMTRIRDEFKFSNQEELRTQLVKDKKNVEEYFLSMKF